MAYTTEIGTALCSTLEKFVTLEPFQLASHVANLDFWLNEIRHVLAVIDGYESRFRRMREGEKAYSSGVAIQYEPELSKTNEFPRTYFGAATPLRKGVLSDELVALRQRVCAAAWGFLNRCVAVGLIRNEVVQSLDFGQ